MSKHVENFDYKFIEEVLIKAIDEKDADNKQIILEGLLEQLYFNQEK